MILDDYLLHWNYFCSLAKMLEDTKDYVYQGIAINEKNEYELLHSNVYSDVFKKIILLAASEFEVITRTLCNSAKKSPRNIVDISSTILNKYPRIVETEVRTVFWTSMPLREWSVDRERQRKKVKGLDWWYAYNAIKHNKPDSYRLATLNNAFLSLASLYIMNMYLMYEVTGHLYYLHSDPPSYFRCKYAPSNVLGAEGKLPDFGNKSAEEVYQEMFSGIVIR